MKRLLEDYAEDPVIGAQFLISFVQGLSVYSKKFKTKKKENKL